MGLSLVMIEDVGWLEPRPLDSRPPPDCPSSPALALSKGNSCLLPGSNKGVGKEGAEPQGTTVSSPKADSWHLATGRQAEPLLAPLLRAQAPPG